MIYGELQTQIMQEDEKLVMKAIRNVGVNVDKEALIKALQYDLNQYTKGYEDGKNDILDKIRAEIKAKIEEEEFARSVFRHEEKDTFKAEQCTGSIMAYNNVIKLIDKYKEESEE